MSKKVNKVLLSILAIAIVIALIVAIFINSFKRTSETDTVLTTDYYGSTTIYNWKSRMKSYGARVGRGLGDNQYEQKWLFIDDDNEYKDLYCIQSGKTHSKEYNVYDLYNIDSSIIKEHFKDMNNYKQFLWILENMYTTNVEGNTKSTEELVNEFLAKVGSEYQYNEISRELASMYPNNLENGLISMSLNGGTGGRIEVDGTENLIKTIQNYLLLAHSIQKGENGEDIGFATNPIKNDKLAMNLYTFKNDSSLGIDIKSQITGTSRSAVESILKYLENGYNSGEYNIDKYKNFYDSSYTGKVQITKNEIEYDNATYKVGPFKITNEYGFNVNIDSLKVGDNSQIEYTLVDENGNLINLSEAGLNDKKFYVQFNNDIRGAEDKAITINYTVDYGYVPTAKILIPNGGEFRAQTIIDISKKHIQESGTCNVNLDSVNPDIALKKYIYKVNDDTVTERLNGIDTETILTENNAKYSMNKTPIVVNNGDKITYKIQLFNEGDVDGTAKVIADYLPLGLEVTDVYAYINNEKNSVQWNNKDDGKTIYFTNPNWTSISNEGDVKNIERFEVGDTGDDLINKSQTIYVECRVVNPISGIYTNISEIIEYQFNDNYSDIDSAGADWKVDDKDEFGEFKDQTPTNREDDKWKNYSNNQNNLLDNGYHYFKGQQDDDDFDKIQINFDLALTKRIAYKISENGFEIPLKTKNDNNAKTKINVESDSDLLNNKVTDLKYNMNKEPAEVNVGDKVVSIIRVQNEGQIDGIVKEVTDYLPEGLKFLETETNEKYNNEGIYSYTYDESAMTIKIKLNGDLGKEIKYYSQPNDWNTKYIEIKLVCEVTKEANGILRNSAAITQYGYMKGNEYIQALYSGVDIDSKGLTYESILRETHISKNAIHTLKELSSIDKDELQLEDDDDVDSIKVVYKPELDLALRKNIYKVESKVGENQYRTKSYESRNPVINEDSLAALNTYKTAEYYHSKVKISVKTGDRVFYKIRVYNEGSEQDYSGRAAQITDYLPEGLKFIGIEESYARDWTATEQSDNKIVIEYKGNTIIKPNSIGNIVNNGDTGYESGYYQEVSVICEVVESDNLILTNRAEITLHQAYDSNDDYVYVGDRDSQPNNMKKPDLENWYYNTVQNESTPKDYYPGEQDDDDFDTVYVSNYDIEINKKDENGNALTETEFDITKYRYTYRVPGVSIAEKWDEKKLNNIQDSITNNGTGSDKFEILTDTFVNDCYIIKEINTDNRHINFLDGKYIKVKISATNGELDTVVDERGNHYEKGFAIYEDNGDDDYENDKLVEYNVLDENSLYNLVNLNIDNTTKKVSVDITNKLKGSFDFKLIKNNLNNDRLNGATFKITIKEDNVVLKDVNEKAYTTSQVNGEDGIIKIDGFEITGAGKNYNIKIEETEPLNGYLKADIINIDATSRLSDDKKTYVLETKEANGVVIENNLITATVTNIQTGSFALNLYKKGSNGSSLKDGKFFITIRKGNTVIYETDTNSLDVTDSRGTIKVDKTKDGKPLEITGENEKYIITIIEREAPEGYLIPDEFSEARGGKVIEAVSSSDVNGNFILTSEDATIRNNIIYVTVTEETKPEEGKYKLQLMKYGKDITKENAERTVLEGVQFQLIGGHVNGGDLQDGLSNKYYSETNPYNIPLTGKEPVDVWMQISMQKMKINDPDTYTLRELDPGNGYYKGIEDNIKVTVNKSSEETTEKIINKVKSVTLTVGKDEETVNFVNGETEKTIEKLINGKKLLIKISVRQDENDNNNTIIGLEVENPKITGNFEFRLVKSDKETNTKLSGAEFSVTINDGTKDIYKKTGLKTGADGYIKEEIQETIDAEGKKYTVTIEETKAPAGYTGLSKPFTFIAESKLSEDGRTYELESEYKTLQNEKILQITSDEIYVEIKNTPIIEEGKYELQLVKYGKNIDGTLNALGGVEFHLIGGKVNGSKLQNSNGTYISEEDYYSVISKEDSSVTIWDVNRISNSVVDTADTFTLKEMEITNESGYYCGITDNLKIDIQKTSYKENSITKTKVKSVTLTIGNQTGNSVTVDFTNSNSKTITQEINGQEIDITVTLQKDNNDKDNTLIIVEVENPKVVGKFNFKLTKVSESDNNIKIPNAGFNISITDVTDGANTKVYETTQPGGDKTNLDGEINIGSFDIYGENRNYEIKIQEVTVPSGYLQAKDRIIHATSQKVTKNDGTVVYELVPDKTQEETIIGANIVETLIKEQEKETEEGTYRIELEKYGKNTDNTKKSLGNVEFHLIGGKVNNDTLRNDTNGNPLSESNYYTYYTEENSAKEIWNVMDIKKDTIDKADEYVLKEAGVPSDLGYYNGLTENIELSVEKTSTKEGNNTIKAVKSVTLKIGNDEQTVDFKNGETSKKITKNLSDGQTIDIVISLRKDPNYDKNTIIKLTVENPQITGTFDFNLTKVSESDNNIKIPNAGFNISITDVTDGANTKVVYETTEPGGDKTNTDGEINIGSFDIYGENRNYEIKIQEVTVPSGYLQAKDRIIHATSQKVTKDDGTVVYELVPDDKQEETIIGANIVKTLIKEQEKKGSYNLKITKVDETDVVIDNKDSKFKYQFGSCEGEDFNEESFEELPVYQYSNGSEVQVTTGVEEPTTQGIISINNIKIFKEQISKEQIRKKYYWIIEETVAPEGYAKLDGKIVVPVTFEEGTKNYKANYSKDAFLIRNNKKIGLGDVDVNYNSTTGTLNIKVPNEKETEEGTYRIELEKYGKNTDNTKKSLGNVEFHLIGGKVNNDTLCNDTNGNPLSESNYYTYYTEENSAKEIWNVMDIKKDTLHIADEYVLKEAGVPSDLGYYNGLTENIELSVEKTSTKEGNNTIKSVKSVTLKIGNDEQTVDFKNGETSKKITKRLSDGQTIDIVISLRKDPSYDKNTIIKLTVENPQITGTFDFKLVKTNTAGDERLNNAIFRVTIIDTQEDTPLLDKDGNSIKNKEYTTSNINGEDGIIKIDGLKITEANKIYNVKIKETQAPENYELLPEEIEFNVTSVLSDDGKSYILKRESNNKIEIENNLITVTEVNNKVGEFRFALVKFTTKNGITGKLAGGKFAITVKQGDNIVYESDGSGDITDKSGKIEIYTTKNATNIVDGTPIVMHEGDKFTINIKEIEAPKGYLIPDEYAGEGRNIQATVVSDADTGKLVLSLDNKENNVTVSNNFILTKVNESYKEEKGTYEIKLVKLGEDGTQLEGVQFNLIKGTINKSKDLWVTDDEGKTHKVSTRFPYKIITRKDAPVDIWRVSDAPLNIVKFDIDTDDTDSYTIQENTAGENNSGYYIGIKDNIKIDITRTSREDDDCIIHSVKSVMLTVGNASETVDFASGETEKTITKIIDGKEIDVKISLQKDTTENTLITLTVENPRVNHGKYKIDLVKYGKDLDGNRTQLGGVTFSRTISQGKLNYTEVLSDKIVTDSGKNTSITNGFGIDGGELVSTAESGVDDKYVITEINIGENSEYTIGLEEPIELTIYKGIKWDTERVNGETRTVVTKSYLAGARLKVGNETKNINVVTGEGRTSQTIVVKTKYGQKLAIKMDVSMNKTTNEAAIILEVENPQVITGKFNFNLVKYEKGEQKKLKDANFNITIVRISDNQGIPVFADEIMTDNEGEILIKDLEITDSDDEFAITIEEKDAPEGYIKANKITFNANAKLSEDKTKFELIPKKLSVDDNVTIANAKLVDIKDDEILVELENIPKPEIHKGVKDIDNQDSGYNENENHDWVIESVVPAGIDEFTKYVITDKIDRRLDFFGHTRENCVGLDSVVVKIKNNEQALVKGKDYKVTYNMTTRELKIIFIDDEFVGGKNLPEKTTIEIRFNTKFALNEDGSIEALGESIQNTSELIFDNGTGEETRKSESPEVHTGGIKVFKYETINRQRVPLEGAKFKIATSKENAEKGIFIKKKDAQGNNTEEDIIGVSNKDGIAEFVGLEFGGDANAKEANKTKDEMTKADVYKYDYNIASTKYWIVETEVPAGYIKWELPVEVNITKDSYNTDVSNMTLIENIRIKGSYDLVINKKDLQGNALNGARVKVTVIRDSKESELYEENNNPNSKNVIIPTEKDIQNGILEISNIRIEKPETYTIKIEEVKEPEKYVKLQQPVEIQVTTKLEGEGSNSKYVLESVNLINGNQDGLIEINPSEEKIDLTIKNEQFDLSLRKYITKVITNEGEENERVQEIANREPQVKVENLKDGDNTTTTAIYNHEKEEIKLYAGDIVIYNIRVYNEGDISGYAEEIIDHLPEGLEFVNDEFNGNNGWLLDENDSSLRTVKTTWLSKAINEKENLIPAFDEKTGVISSKEIQIKCKVKDDVQPKEELTNIAEISKYTGENGRVVVDRDSEKIVELPSDEELPNYKDTEIERKDQYIPGQEDDDDFEKVIVEKFDLALRKYITQVDNNQITNRAPVFKIGEDGSYVYEHTKEPVLVGNSDVVTYNIQVYNEGTMAGYAEEIEDDIPEGLVYLPNNETNKGYEWVMLDENKQETKDVSKAKYIRTKFLSSENKENLLKSFDKDTMKEPDSKFVKVAFKVVVPDATDEIIINKAQITDDKDEQGKEVFDYDSTPNEWIEKDDDQDIEKIKLTYFDLALRKFITKVEDTDVKNRVPVFKVDENGKYVYEHTKEPVIVNNTNILTYTLRIYNEGTREGYAKEIKDDIPQGLKFLPDNETNKEYRWIMLDENENETDNVNEAKYITSDYLSKENEVIDGENLLSPFSEEDYEAGSIKEPDNKEVEVCFEVTEPNTSDRIIINYAQISDDSDEDGNDVEDKDSTPNEWNKDEDDQDIEQIFVEKFDLALRKWVTKAIVIEDGKETVYETGHTAEDDPEEVVKVDLKKSKINKVVVKFEYKIRVTNESKIPGSVEEISDYIPEGLKFVAADNPKWEEVEGKVVTNQLSGKILQEGESAEVTILLTWINSENNMGLKVNVAEISKDYNEYGTPDVDSTPNNKVPGEDDIDDAKVMLSVTTGETVIYIGIAIAVLGILAGGAIGIKKFVIK